MKPQNTRTLLPLAAAFVAGAIATAHANPTTSERYDLANAQVTLHVYDFLDEDELATLRLVGQNEEALALFLTEGTGGFGALAVAPADGFIRQGMPAESAVALSDLPDIDRAKAAAVAECNSLRSGGRACEVVLEIAPR